MLDLFRLSGYSEPISENEFAEHLEVHPDLIEAWLLESADTRYSPAWYFRPCNSNPKTWEVGLYPGTEIHRFGDQYSACAFYVCRFIDQLGKIEPSRGATESK